MAAAATANPAAGISIVLDTDTLVTQGDGKINTIGGGVVEASVLPNGIASFKRLGDLDLAAGDRLSFVGGRPGELVVGGNAVISPGAVVTASARGSLAGAGGGSSRPGAKRSSAAIAR